MRVFFLDKQVINVDDNCPSIKRLLKADAEEIPLEVFKGNPQYADSTNTRKIEGIWTFSLNADLVKALENEAKTEAIKRDLYDIDIESMRPVRAIQNGNGTQADKDKLAALEVQAQALRKELATLLAK